MQQNNQTSTPCFPLWFNRLVRVPKQNQNKHFVYKILFYKLFSLHSNIFISFLNMRNSKVRPIKLSNNSYASSSINTSLQLQVTPNLQLDHGSWSLRGREFWYARRAFLNSYHFNLERENVGFKEKLKRLVKEVSEAATRIALDMRRKMHKRRLGIRAYRVTMSLPSMFLVTMRCFMPWFNKKGDFVM